MRWVTWLMSASLAACVSEDAPIDADTDDTDTLVEDTSDDDADGLGHDAEIASGTDPANPDSDADGVLDGDEVARGMNPLANDSDGDGLLDADELKYGFDPVDAESDGYAGGWPLQEVSVKEPLAASATYTPPLAVGARVPREHFVDHLGDVVDLYDYAQQGKVTLLDLSAGWCDPCKALGSFMGGASAAEAFPDLEDTTGLEAIRDAVNDGTIQWVTVLGESRYYNAPVLDDAQRWHQTYPSDAFPVLVDNEQQLYKWILRATLRLPSVLALDENLDITGIALLHEEIPGLVDLEAPAAARAR